MSSAVPESLGRQPAVPKHDGRLAIAMGAACGAGPRLLLNKQHENGPVSRGARPLVQASFRNCLADPHRSPLFLIKTGTNFLKGSIQTAGKDELRQEYLFA